MLVIFLNFGYIALLFFTCYIGDTGFYPLNSFVFPAVSEFCLFIGFGFFTFVINSKYAVQVAREIGTKYFEEHGREISTEDLRL